MTVLEASGELFNWFDKNDKFDLEEDISKLLKTFVTKKKRLII